MSCKTGAKQRALFAAATLFAFLLFACQETEDGVCIVIDTCHSQPPTTAVLEVRVSPGAQSVAIYAGDNIETGRLVLTRESPEGDFDVALPLGNYAAVAKYFRVEQTILAVDADELSYSEGEKCEQTCYTAKDGVVQLTLDRP